MLFTDGADPTLRTTTSQPLQVSRFAFAQHRHPPQATEEGMR